jgi:hypothetical protein
MIAELDRHPSAGFAFSGYDVIDEYGEVMRSVLMPGSKEVQVEDHRQYVLETFRTVGRVCFSSVMYRRASIEGVGGLQNADPRVADQLMWLEIALNWNALRIRESLLQLRTDSSTASAAVARVADGRYYFSSEFHDIVLTAKLDFIDRHHASDLALPGFKLRQLARRRWRHDVVESLSEDSWPARDLRVVILSLYNLARRDPLIAFTPGAVRLIVSALVGRRVRNTLRRLRRRPTPPSTASASTTCSKRTAPLHVRSDSRFPDVDS